MKNLSLFLCLLITSFSAKSQFSITGALTDQPFTQVLQDVRLTLFNADTTFFRETRSDIAGNYSFSNIPANTYSLGVSFLNKEYQQITINLAANASYNFTLLPETQMGQWDIIIQSPEPLGGTDLGLLQPDGKIFYCHDTKDPFVFDPQTNDTTRIQGDVNIQGCAAPLQLPDGKILFAGGAAVAVYGPGTRKIKTYDYLTGNWQTKPNMLGYRWYPSATILSDGKILITGGGTQLNPQRTNSTEIYDPVTGISLTVDTTAIPQEQSPILMLYNGKILMTHRPPQLYDPLTQLWDACADFQQGNRMPNGDHADHELVHLPEGIVVAVGYKSFTTGVPGNLIEKYNEQTDTWSLGTNSIPTRSRPEAVLLPGKNILVIAGQKEDNTDPTPVNQWGMMDITDMYNPYSNQWRRLASMNYKREYHALAVLVPDGRIIMAGGEGQPGNEPPLSIIEGFKPPYLFRGIRPEIINFSQNVYQRGSQIVFDVIKTNAVTQVILISTPVVTHMMNTGNNRYAELAFTQSGNTVTANIPSDALNVLNGYYQLFAMVDDIPSVSKIIKVETSIPVSIDETVENNFENNFLVYPNPSSETFTIQLPDANLYDVSIITADGRIIYQQKNSFTQVQINSKNISAGIYYITATSKSGLTISKKIILYH